LSSISRVGGVERVEISMVGKMKCEIYQTTMQFLYVSS
jgi:hypothetical protein